MIPTTVNAQSPSSAANAWWLVLNVPMANANASRATITSTAGASKHRVKNSFISFNSIWKRRVCLQLQLISLLLLCKFTYLLISSTFNFTLIKTIFYGCIKLCTINFRSKDLRCSCWRKCSTRLKQPVRKQIWTDFLPEEANCKTQWTTCNSSCGI